MDDFGFEEISVVLAAIDSRRGHTPYFCMLLYFDMYTFSKSLVRGLSEISSNASQGQRDSFHDPTVPGNPQVQLALSAARGEQLAILPSFHWC